MSPTKDDVPEGFSGPRALPTNSEQAASWQNANRSWWESHPMRYDWRDRLGVQEFSKEFYQEIDQRFFSNTWEFMPWKEKPFEQLMDFQALRNEEVLEIGVGSGSHAQLLAANAKSFTGIDLTEYASKSTSGRMKCFGLNGQIFRMDAENLTFPDNTFDLVWSWGVIHCSADTRNALKQIHRVLRPGGRTVLMVYHKSFWLYYIACGLFRGVLGGDLLKTRSLHKTVQRATDGGLARYYTMEEWGQAVGEFFKVEKVLVLGSKAEMFPIPGGRIKNLLMNLVPNRVTAFFTNDCQMGSFVVAIARKEK